METVVKYLFIASLFALLTTVGATVSYKINQGNITSQQPIACTQEAMQCPDGSYVGRQGPKCEFDECPVTALGTIKGKADIGPICPVEQPDTPCPVPPEAYTSREVILYLQDGVTEIKRMHFLADGTYSFQVSPGTYVINIPRQGVGGSGNLPKTLVVKSGEVIEFNFSIDTGIR